MNPCHWIFFRYNSDSHLILHFWLFFGFIFILPGITFFLCLYLLPRNILLFALIDFFVLLIKNQFKEKVTPFLEVFHALIFTFDMTGMLNVLTSLGVFCQWLLTVDPLVTLSLLCSVVGEEDPTSTGNERSTEVVLPSQRSLKAPRWLQTSSLSTAPTPSPTAVRGEGRSTCPCGSREPTSCVNAVRWRAERSCSTALRRKPLKLPQCPTMPRLFPQRPVRVTCLSLPCPLGCLSPSPRCPFPSLSLRWLSRWWTWARRNQEGQTTGVQAGAGTGWPASSDPVRALKKGPGTGATGTVRLAPRWRVWTAHSRLMRCHRWDAPWARRGNYWTRGTRKKRERKQMVKESLSRTTVGHALSIRMRTLVRTAKGKNCAAVCYSVLLRQFHCFSPHTAGAENSE